MLRNYFVIAFRNILRNKVYSSINIFGLALGVACCLLLSLYIQHELSYDSHHNRLNDLYRITTRFTTDRGIDKLPTTSPPIAMALWDEIPEIESAARALNPPGLAQNLIKYKDNVFYETNGFIADSTLFAILTYEFIEGNSEKALVEGNSVVISDQFAKKLFGSESALDKNITISQGGPVADYKITGVFKSNIKSHLQANFFTSMTSSGWGEYIRNDPDASNEWAGQNFVPSYVRLSSDHNKELVEKKMNEVLQKHGAEDMKALGMQKTLALEPVKDIYLRSDIGQSPRIKYLYVLGSIAAFILLIGCINFMNLSTAKATKRAAEIGIRKVMGAYRGSLIRQVMGEALLIVIIAVIISIGLVQLGLPLFNHLTGKEISLATENMVYFSSALVALIVITSFLAGSYPAFYLSSFQPAQVLKGKFMMSNSTGWLRQGLVIFQFMIAITLVCGMLIISKQLNFMQSKDLGFDTKAKIVIPLRTEDARSQYDALKKELQQKSSVREVAGAEYVPGSFIWNDMLYYTEGGNMDNAVMHRRNLIDAGYMEMMGIKLLAGRHFTDNRKVDSEAKLILNQTAVKKLGFETDKAIGQHIYFDWQGDKYMFEIIGVMDDYHQTSLKEAINPTIFELAPDTQRLDHLVVNVQADQFDATIASIEKTWKALINDTPFEYSFLDDTIQKQYDEDRRVAKIITSFTVIAMIICCLGLYGLSTYMAERRFKEIGVRKVMGASVSQIMGMMSKEFIRLVVIALLISIPLAWYAMEQWLSGFAYRISINPLTFVLAGSVALLIALITVGYESLRAASVNPVDSLRNE